MKTKNCFTILFSVGFLTLNHNYSAEILILKLALLLVTAVLLSLLYSYPLSNHQKQRPHQSYSPNNTVKNYNLTPSHQLSPLELANEFFKKGNYETSIRLYLKALQAGADPDDVDDNVWKAFEKIYRKTKDTDFVKKYFDWCPNGAHQAEANAIIIGHYG